MLFEIKKELEGLLSQTQKLEKGPHSLHQIDKDLLLEKTRRLYEKMMALEEAEQAKTAKEQEPEIPVEKEASARPSPADPFPETGIAKNGEMPESRPAPAPPKPDTTAAKTVTGIPEETAEPVAAGQQAPVEEKPVAAPETEKKPEPPEKENEPEASAPEPAETTLDLFSTAPPETLGEALKPSEKPAIADTLQSSGIADLREAIGINDKFLFINELFNGDLERYNKVLDELNGFTGLSGAQTYLAELQVQYQWEENSPAYLKLSNLLERKFA